jgi:hypothetical protein
MTQTDYAVQLTASEFQGVIPPRKSWLWHPYQMEAAVVGHLSVSGESSIKMSGYKEHSFSVTSLKL